MHLSQMRLSKVNIRLIFKYLILTELFRFVSCQKIFLSVVPLSFIVTILIYS